MIIDFLIVMTLKDHPASFLLCLYLRVGELHAINDATACNEADTVKQTP